MIKLIIFISYPSVNVYNQLNIYITFTVNFKINAYSKILKVTINLLSL